MIILPLVLNVICIVTALIVVIRDDKTKSVPLFSLRNIFIMGFLYFQSFGLFGWLFDREAQSWWSYLVKDTNYGTSSLFALYLNIFLLVFLFAYKKFKVSLKKEYGTKYVTPRKLAQVSVILTIMALFIWLGGVLGLPGELMRFISAGVGTTATGLAAWAWASDRNLNKLPYIVLVVCITLANVAPHLTDYGRRGIVSIAFVIAWALYYRFSFKYSATKIITTTALLGVPMFILLALFSEVRVSRPQSTADAAQAMLKADLGNGMQRLATTQGATPIAMWCMENYPQPNAYRHCHSATAVFLFFVPRIVWEDKPDGLGKAIPDLAGLTNVGGLNVGAGMIGHASAEGGFYAVVLYAILLGVFLKFLDSVIRAKSSPIYRVALAAALGDLFATSRGEVNFFLDIMVMAIISGLIVSLIVVKVTVKPTSF